MHRKIKLAMFTLFLCACCSAEPVWQVAMSESKTGRILTVSNLVLTVTLSEKAYWTIREIHSGGTLMVGAYGANGAVANVKPAARPPDNKDSFMGTGHGFETISSYKVTLDGRDVDLKSGEGLSARVVTLTKISKIGPLDQIAVIEFPASGDRLVEQTRFTANCTLADNLNFVYAYMHCNDNALTDWLAWLDADKTIEGRCVSDDRSYGLQRDVRAVALFGPEIGKGLVYTYPEVYAGGAKGNFFWDRVRDNKLYFRPRIPGVINLAGDTVLYELTIMPFSATTSDWREQAKKCLTALLDKK